MAGSKSTWKAFERRMCRRFHGDRRGADYGDKDGGKNDCIDATGWSIEVKNMKRPSFKIMQTDAQHAIERKENPNDIGIAIMKKHGERDDDALVVMKLHEFEKHFVNERIEE